MPATFAWKNVKGGEIDVNGKDITVTAYNNSLQAYKANAVSVKSLEAEFEICGDFKEAGMVLYCAAHEIEDTYEFNDPNGIAWNDYVWDAYYVSFDKSENAVILNSGMVNPVCRRKFDFTEKDNFHVRIIAGEGQFELYIDDVMFMHCGMKTESCIAPGLFAFSGKVEFANLKVYELEN